MGDALLIAEIARLRETLKGLVQEVTEYNPTDVDSTATLVARAAIAKAEEVRS